MKPRFRYVKYLMSIRTSHKRDQVKKKKTRIRYVLRRCALEIDAAGTLKLLADDYGWHPLTPSRWIKDGGVPERVAKALCSRFGEIVGFTAEEIAEAA